jgi:pyruvate formate lyase activating enzyme
MRKLSVIDYPKKLCMDLTIAGCNYRCPFCPHQKLIFDYIPMEKISLDEIIKALKPRLGFLDGVSITGGEPLLHRNIIDFLRELKSHGSLIKLKTNASRPNRIKILIDKNLVDFFSVFIPAPLSKYNDVVKYKIDKEKITSSIQMIRRSGISHEFRIKPVPSLIGMAEVKEIANYLVGAPRFVIERFNPEKSMEEDYRLFTNFSEKELNKIKNVVSPFFNEVIIE